MNNIMKVEKSNSDGAVFSFGDKVVRTAGTPDRPLFCAADVCSVLGIADAAQACSRLDQDEVEELASKQPIPCSESRSAKGGRKALFVTEPGLYSLIVSSRKPEAKEFKRWVNHEVLPAIRKTGSYAIQAMSPAQQLMATAQALLAIEQAQAEQEKRLSLIEPRIERLEHADAGMMTVLQYWEHRGTPFDTSVSDAYAILTELEKRAKRIAQVTRADVGRQNRSPTFELSVLRDLYKSVHKEGQ